MLHTTLAASVTHAAAQLMQLSMQLRLFTTFLRLARVHCVIVVFPACAFRRSKASKGHLPPVVFRRRLGRLKNLVEVRILIDGLNTCRHYVSEIQTRGRCIFRQSIR